MNLNDEFLFLFLFLASSSVRIYFLFYFFNVNDVQSSTLFDEVLMKSKEKKFFVFCVERKGNWFFILRINFRKYFIKSNLEPFRMA